MEATSLKSFRTLNEPCGGNPIRDIQFSGSGDRFLVASGAWQAKLFDREGGQLVEYNKVGGVEQSVWITHSYQAVIYLGRPVLARSATHQVRNPY